MHLDRADRLLLIGFGGVIFLLATITNPMVSFDGAVLIQSTREMHQAAGSWLIPTVGGVPLLDQAPALQWVIGLLASDWGGPAVLLVTRLVCALALIALSLLTAFMAAQVFGRRTGLLTGLTMMTTVSLVQSVGEARGDLFFALLIALVNVAFLRSEIALTQSEPLRARLPKSLVTGRRREVIEFYLSVALAALVCPPSILMVSLLIPLLTYLATGRLKSAAREYLWLWGLCGVFLAALAWPMTIGRHLPTAWSVWFDWSNVRDWLSGFTVERLEQRCSNGVATAFALSVSWGVLAPVGMWFTRHESLGCKRSLERILWTHAGIAPMAAILLLDQPRTALFATVSVWNVLAAVGIERTIEASMRIVRDWLINARINMPLPSFPVSRISITSAFVMFAGVFVPMIWTDSIGFQTALSERAFLRDVIARLPGSERIAIDMELGADGVQALCELADRAAPLHNLSYVLSQPESDQLLVLTRRRGLRALCLVGSVTEIVCRESLSEATDDELTLFCLKLAPGMANRVSVPAEPSLAQALRKEAGPWVGGWQLSSRSDVEIGRQPNTMIAIESNTEATRRH